MRSLRLALVLLGIVAVLSVGFAQGKGGADKGKMDKKPMMAKKPGSAQAVRARQHGKMVVKVKGKGMAAIAKHHGKMAPKHAVKKHVAKRTRRHGAMHRHMTMKPAVKAKAGGDHDKDDKKKGH